MQAGVVRMRKMGRLNEYKKGFVHKLFDNKEKLFHKLKSKLYEKLTKKDSISGYQESICYVLKLS